MNKKALILIMAVVLVLTALGFIFLQTKKSEDLILPPIQGTPPPIIEEPLPPPPEKEPEPKTTTTKALPPSPPREPREFIININSDSRVEPANLTIRVGDTVTFINNDNKLHWPGADPHPTHSSLPPFDALGGISKGQSYSYTFRKAGVYGYHEHLIDPNPPTLGFITVLP